MRVHQSQVTTVKEVDICSVDGGCYAIRVHDFTPFPRGRGLYRKKNAQRVNRACGRGGSRCIGPKKIVFDLQECVRYISPGITEHVNLVLPHRQLSDSPIEPCPPPWFVLKPKYHLKPSHTTEKTRPNQLRSSRVCADVQAEVADTASGRGIEPGKLLRYKQSEEESASGLKKEPPAMLACLKISIITLKITERIIPLVVGGVGEGRPLLAEWERKKEGLVSFTNDFHEKVVSGRRGA
ncbi:hypothetical protein AAG570_006658 [Ranatra chinensis]|uniref:Uncharacterized protein n=1 Tax=Ranatra chinensis TaxID=642074 RepID=A0ABD0YUN1_9HEMI